MKRGKQRKEETNPTAHQELNVLQSLAREMKALWSTCDLIERRFQLAEIDTEGPSSRADALDSCGRMKAEIEKHLPTADRYYSGLLEGIAVWARMKMPVEEMSFPDKSYRQWLVDVVKLQYSTRAWRERIWLEIDNLPWADVEKVVIADQLLWETTPPAWLRLACEHHRMRLVSEPPALGGGIEIPDRSENRTNAHQLAAWSESRIPKLSEEGLGKAALTTE